MQIYLVGGAVRDSLLSLPVQERDWVVVGSSAEELLAQGYQQVGKDFPVFLHPQTHEEYALARTERKSGTGHRGFQVYSSPDVTLEQDLLRRDLTINAIAQSDDGSLIDPYDGQSDINKRVLKHVSPAFSEDPLRVLRVARFAARFWSLGFTIDPSTLALMASISNSNELQLLSKQRVWQETKRALSTKHPEIYFLVLLQINALENLSPQLATALNSKSALLNLAQLKNIHNSHCRFACLCLIASENTNNFDANIANAINLSFDCPNELQEFTLLVVENFSTCCQALESNSEDIYNLLQSLDAFRREARCVNVIECICHAQHIFQHDTSGSLKFLLDIIPKLNSICISQRDKQQLSGKAIGEKVKLIRIKQIESELAAIK